MLVHVQFQFKVHVSSFYFQYGQSNKYGHLQSDRNGRRTREKKLSCIGRWDEIKRRNKKKC